MYLSSAFVARVICAESCSMLSLRTCWVDASCGRIWSPWSSLFGCSIDCLIIECSWTSFSFTYGSDLLLEVEFSAIQQSHYPLLDVWVGESQPTHASSDRWSNTLIYVHHLQDDGPGFFFDRDGQALSYVATRKIVHLDILFIYNYILSSAWVSTISMSTVRWYPMFLCILHLRSLN